MSENYDPSTPLRADATDEQILHRFLKEPNQTKTSASDIAFIAREFAAACVANLEAHKAHAVRVLTEAMAEAHIVRNSEFGSMYEQIADWMRVSESANMALGVEVRRLAAALPEDREPVAWAVTYSGEFTSNIFTDKAEAIRTFEFLENKYPERSHGRKIIPLYPLYSVAPRASEEAKPFPFPDASYDIPLEDRLTAASADGPSIPRLGISGTNKHSIPLTSAEARELLRLLSAPAAARGEEKALAMREAAAKVCDGIAGDDRIWPSKEVRRIAGECAARIRLLAPQSAPSEETTP